MKNVLRIFGIVFGCLMGVVLIGFFILFLTGAFEENKTKPENLSFVIGSLADDDTRFDLKTSGPFDLKLTTTTEDVSPSIITLSVDKVGIIEIPQSVSLDQTFVIWPINNGGNNVGGRVEISASCGAAFAKCTVFVDVKTRTITSVVSGEDFDETSQGYIVEKDDLISFGYSVTPTSAANPGLLASGTSNSPDGKEKEVIFALYDAGGYNYLNNGIATFATATGTNIGSSFSTGTYAVNNVRIKINSLSNEVFYLKAYIFETYQLQEENASKTIDEKIQNMIGYVAPVGETVSTDPNRTKFTIGDAIIEGIQTADVTLSSYMNETKRIYLKKDVESYSNLDISFSSNLTNVGSNYFNYLINNLEFSGTGLDVVFVKASDSSNSYIEVTTNADAYVNNILNNSILTIKYKTGSSPDTYVMKNLSIVNNVRKYNPTIQYTSGQSINVGNETFQMSDFFTSNDKALISSSVTNSTFNVLRYYIENTCAEEPDVTIIKVTQDDVSRFIVSSSGTFVFGNKTYGYSETTISGEGVTEDGGGVYKDGDMVLQVMPITYKAIKVTLSSENHCYLIVNGDYHIANNGAISFGDDSEIGFAKGNTPSANVAIRGRVVVYKDGAAVMNANTADFTWVEDDNLLISFDVTNG